MQIAGLLNGTNINQDYMLSMGLEAIISSPGAIVSGLAVTTNTVAVGKAVIRCTRTNGQVVFVSYSNTASVTIDSSGTKKVWVEVSQAKLDDGTSNSPDGTGIAVVNTGASYPAGNYIPLASITGGVITDARPLWIKQNIKSANIASATTTDLATATGDEVHITGTTPITGLGILPAGVEMTLIFDGITTLTHNATSLILPGGANRTTAAGDSYTFRSEGSGNWRCVAYALANGQAIDNSTNITGLTEDTTGDMTADYLVKNNGTGANKKIKVSKYMASDAENLAGTSEVKFTNVKQTHDSIKNSVDTAVGKSTGTNYQAATSGYVVAYGTCGSDNSGSISGYVGASNPAGTKMAQSGLNYSGAGGQYISIMFPVMKDQWYRVDFSAPGFSPGSAVVNFVPNK